MSIDQLPLCDAGRCSALLGAMAQSRDGQTERLGGQVVHVIGRVLDDFGLDVADLAVRESVVRHIRALLDPAARAS